MKTSSPNDTIIQLINAANAGDLETVLSLYEPGASYVAQPGMVATGTLMLREALSGFMALKPTVTNEGNQVVEAGDVALYCWRWSLSGTDPAGNPVQMNGRASDVLRRQQDGNWLIAVDNPWGTDIVA